MNLMAILSSGVWPSGTVSAAEWAAYVATRGLFGGPLPSPIVSGVGIDSFQTLLWFFWRKRRR